jgi:predicted site-specific integrase-resolvase
MNSPIATWPRLLDLKGAALYLSVGSRTVEDWVKDGLLDPVPMPGGTLKDKSGNVIARARSRRIAKILLDREDLDRLISARKGAE